jgi:hypothetical protein
VFEEESRWRKICCDENKGQLERRKKGRWRQEAQKQERKKKTCAHTFSCFSRCLTELSFSPSLPPLPSYHSNIPFLPSFPPSLFLPRFALFFFFLFFSLHTPTQTPTLKKKKREKKKDTKMQTTMSFCSSTHPVAGAHNTGDRLVEVRSSTTAAATADIVGGLCREEDRNSPGPR